MKVIPLIILIVLVQVSCSKQNDDLSFLNGEWISDTIKTKKDDHWRELLYFKNGKLLAQTTFLGENYILNKNRNIHQNQFTDGKGNKYTIHIIDSLHLEIKGDAYYGKFRKDKSQPDHIEDVIRDAEKAQENKTQLMGTWKMIKTERRFSDYVENQKDPINQSIIKSSEFDKIIYFPAASIDHMQLDDAQFTIYLKDAKKHSFPYSVTPEFIEISSGDMIYKLRYKIIAPGQFKIETYDRIGIYIDFIFQK